MGERPLLLVTNDDGIEADGLWHLAEALSEIGDIMIAAPAFNQSAMSAAFTLRREIESERAHSRLDGVDAWQVSGTPADAVTVGLRRYAPRRVSMIVSGVNPGPNVGRNILHSGTIMAAMMGFLRGLPSVAVSLASLDEQYLASAARAGAEVAARLLESGRPMLLNVNAPAAFYDDYGGFEVARMADVAMERLAETVDEHGTARRRLEGRDDVSAEPGTDVAAVLAGRVAVTPLHNDLTRHEDLAAAAALIG